MSTEYNQRAAVGQAFNLAVHDAIASQNQDSPEYIYKRFVYYRHLSEIVQSSDLELIQEAINNKAFDKVMKQLSEVLK